MHRRRAPKNTAKKPEVTAAVLWASCLEGLERLQDGLEADEPAAAGVSIAGIFDILREVEDLSPKLRAITWNDLILRQQTQVPLRLGKICSQAIQQQHQLSATTAALAAMCLLMHKAELLGASDSRRTDGASSLRLGMVNGIQQQLQQSGLLQVLPEAFAAAAAMLQANGCDTAVAAASSAEKDSLEASEISHSCSSSHHVQYSTAAPTDQSGNGNGTNSSSTDSYGSSDSRDGTRAAGPADAASIQQHAEVLLCLFAAVPRLWPQLTADHPETSIQMARIAVAGVQLVQTVMQAVSKQVQQAEQSGEPYWQGSHEALLLYSLLLQAHTAMRSLLDSIYSIDTAATHSVMPQCDLGTGSTAQHGTAAAAAAAATGREQLLSSPHYMQCLGLMAAVLSYSIWPPIKCLHLQGRGQDGSGSDSTTAMKSSWYAQPSCYAPGGAPGQTLHEDLQQQQAGYMRLLFSPLLAAAASTAWEDGSRLRDTLTEHQQKLFARLGVDSVTVSWAAASAADVPSTNKDTANNQYSVTAK